MNERHFSTEPLLLLTMMMIRHRHQWPPLQRKVCSRIEGEAPS